MYAILNDELAHHGIKGQHWGIRRFQNADGSLKPAGEKRYGGSKKEERQAKKREAIEEYSKVIDSYNQAKKKSEEIWEEARAKYESLGPDDTSRWREARKAELGRKGAKKAAKEYFELSKKSDDVLYEALDRKRQAEKRLGKSVVKAYNKETKRAAKKAEKIKNVLNTKIGGTDEGKKSLKQTINDLDPRVKKAFVAATAVTLATVLLSKNAHKNDAKQRIKRTEKRAKYAERSLNRFQL